MSVDDDIKEMKETLEYLLSREQQLRKEIARIELDIAEILKRLKIIENKLKVREHENR